MGKMLRIFISKILIFLIVIIIFFSFIILLKRRYPVYFKEDVVNSSKEFNLNPKLVFSVIRAESGFNANALSDKGAKGLMQIIDSTAEFIANKLNVDEYNLYDPKTNIRFGCYYIRYLFDKFEITDTVLCAYNAGEGNVARWLKDERYSKNNLSLDIIPFKETREYVKKVNKNFKIYEKIYADFVDKS